MKTYALLPIALLTLMASVSRPAPSSHKLTDARRTQVESEVSDFMTSYPDVIQGDDDDAIRRLYVADGRFAWFTDGEKRYTSADEVLASLASMKGMELSTDVSDVEILPLTPNLAHARSVFQTQIIQGGKVVFEFDGVITWLIEEVKDREWRVLTGHTSMRKER